MIGGALNGGKLKKMIKNEKFSSLFAIFFMIVLVLLIKAYVVQLTYNMMWPKIVENSGGDTSRFKPLTFYESLMVVILFSFLFGY
tara:strand:- start:297 stop:551 length:255 start_codon:yes stop_codon:yes gene_type:complete